MTKLAITTLTAIGLAAAAGVTLPVPVVGAAGPSWTADTGAAGTIKQLQDQGYTVNINRVGAGPLDKCQVTDVRNPVTITRLNREHHTTHPGDLVPIVVSRTVKVTLDCTAR